jgi:hypothetical protein
MTKRPLLFACAGLLGIALLNNDGHAQSRDPHLPTPPGLDQSVIVDDMLLTPEQLATLTALPASRRQANIYGLNLRFGYWDWGVIPYEFAPNFSDAERQRIRAAMDLWGRVAPVTFVPRTTQTGFLAVTRDEVIDTTTASPCFGAVGQVGYGRMQRVNLGGTCSLSSRTILHELGHVVGLHHEHQRADRDNYITIDIGNVTPNIRFAYDKYNFALAGPYDFLSIMHYEPFASALDRSRPVIVPHPQYQSLIGQIGRLPEPSDTDHNVVALLYNNQLRESELRFPTESVRSRFDRGEMLIAMERLHAFYMSRLGLQRPQGLSINGRPDFLGIAQWIFDVYLPARSAGFSSLGAFDIVAAAITRTDEWRQKNPARTAQTPSSFRPTVSLNRDEFLDVLNRLDRFYAAPEGLRRENGLSIAGGPDFLGIATWIFDIYLAERLNGISPNGAWTITENAIRATDEWRSKH